MPACCCIFLERLIPLHIEIVYDAIYVPTVRLRSLWKFTNNLARKIEFLYFLEASPNWFQSDNIITYSGFEVKISFKIASVNPLAEFLKPQSPAERLAAQHRDREKLHVWTKRLTTFLPFLFPHLRVPLCVAIAACKLCKPLTSLSLLLSTVQPQPQLQPQPEPQPQQ